MNQRVPQIGVLRIVVPDEPQLLEEHGQSLADQYLKDVNVEDFIMGRLKVHIVTPESFSRFVEGGGGSKILAEFYSGLLESFLERVRDAVYPDAKEQLDRAQTKSRISVARSSVSEESTKDEIIEIFTSATEFYDGLERFIADKIRIGVLHDDGQVTLAQFSAGREMQDTNLDPELERTLFAFSYKYYKALDGMYQVNFNRVEWMAKAQRMLARRDAGAAP